MSKKKLFISCPMKGRTPENILATRDKLHKIAEAITGGELEVIENYNPNVPYSERPIEALGESVKLMQDADYFIQPSDAYKSKGCNVEWEVAIEYDLCILRMNVSTICPDYNYRNECKEDC